MFCKIGILQLGQRTSKNLYKSSFLVKMKDGLIMVLLYRYFGFIEPLCRWLPLVDIFEACFPPVTITNPQSVGIISKCSDLARINQASAMKLFCKKINSLKLLTIFAKGIHFKCLIDSSYTTEVRIILFCFVK